MQTYTYPYVSVDVQGQQGMELHTCVPPRLGCVGPVRHGGEAMGYPFLVVTKDSTTASVRL